MTAADNLKAVIFDFYGTLAVGRPRHLYEDVLAEFPPDLADAILLGIEEIVEFPLGLALPEPFSSAAAYDAWLFDQAQSALRQHYLIDASDAEVTELAQRLLYCNSVVDLVALPGAHDLLATLQTHGYAIGICSNWTWDLPEQLAALGFDGFVDSVVASARVAVSKPAHEIYRLSLAALECGPGDVLFVGDTYETDVEGPQQLGIETLQVAPDGSDLPAVARRLSLPSIAQGSMR